jgi:hypothetical protein
MNLVKNILFLSVVKMFYVSFSVHLIILKLLNKHETIQISDNINKEAENLQVNFK